MKTSQLPAGKPLISPRFGYNWNVFGTDFTSTENLTDTAGAKEGERMRSTARPWWQRGTVIRGGIGVFTGVTPGVFSWRTSSATRE